MPMVATMPRKPRTIGMIQGESPEEIATNQGLTKDRILGPTVEVAQCFDHVSSYRLISGFRASEHHYQTQLLNCVGHPSKNLGIMYPISFWDSQLISVLTMTTILMCMNTVYIGRPTTETHFSARQIPLL